MILSNVNALPKSIYKTPLCNYDSDWSEIEDLIEDLPDDDPNEEEEFLT